MLKTTFILILLSGLIYLGTSKVTLPQTENKTLSYNEYLDSLSKQKSAIDSGDFDLAKKLLFETINDHIPSYWIGTKWNFNGTSQTPKSGTIACGYFLTTVMKQTGYNIERVKMAQQASSVLINAYCTDIKTLGSKEKIKAYLAAQPDSSVFILGLDFHVVFVAKNGSDNQIIHSNYIDNMGVVKENFDNAQVLSKNTFFMIGNLSANTKKMNEWMGW
ncbi:MAG: hypothetical protein H6607_07000 [Flavobacteriales bacterium]|nr:hypothetical protein [Flavobacteriales bacterium]